MMTRFVRNMLGSVHKGRPRSDIHRWSGQGGTTGGQTWVHGLHPQVTIYMKQSFDGANLLHIDCQVGDNKRDVVDGYGNDGIVYKNNEVTYLGSEY